MHVTNTSDPLQGHPKVCEHPHGKPMVSENPFGGLSETLCSDPPSKTGLRVASTDFRPARLPLSLPAEQQHQLFGPEVVLPIQGWDEESWWWCQWRREQP